MAFTLAVHIVLVPLGALGVYVLGTRSGGRLVGYGSALIWTLGPLASLHYFIGPNWLDQTLPMSLGLTALLVSVKVVLAEPAG